MSPPKMKDLLERLGPLDETDWAELALACADQAGLSGEHQDWLNDWLISDRRDNVIRRAGQCRPARKRSP